MTIDLSRFRRKYINIGILLLVFVLYGNSINNEYSMDDNIVVDKNGLVEGGLKAIPEIFKSRYAVDRKQQYEYRPLVSVTFAIEKQFFKGLPTHQTKKEKERSDQLTQANISHFINVLLYALSCVLLYRLLASVFEEYNVILPLVVVLLYVVHPLHTEVVASIKSRDEILMFMFMILAMIKFLKYGKTGSWANLIIAPVFVILSFFAKRNALLLIGILPVILYFCKVSYKRILLSMLILISVWYLFVAMRAGLVTQKVVRNLEYFENPLFYGGSFIDRLALGLYCSWFYFKMLLFPYHLSFYYGFNQIPIATFKFWQVWAAIVLYGGLVFIGLKEFLKRKVLGLGILLWLGVMLTMVNVFIPVVGIVGDRFAYTFSLGFCIVVAYILMKAFKVPFKNNVVKLKLSQSFMLVLLGVTMIYSVRTIARNPDWHDYLTLYQNDIEHLENSAKAHALISNTMYPMVLNDVRNNVARPGLREDVELVIFHYKEALRVDSTYVTCHNNLGSAYINFYGDYQNGLKHCLVALQLKPDYEEAAANIASAYNGLNQPDSAIHYILKAIELNTENQGAFNMFTQLLKNENKMAEGLKQLEQLEGKVDNKKYLFLNIGNLYSSELGNISKAIAYFEKARQIDPSDKRICQHIAGLYGQLGNQTKANEVLGQCN